MFIGFYETTSVASGLHLNSTILPQKLAENALGLVKFLPQTRRKSTPLFRAHKMERMSLGCVDWRSARTSTLEMWTCSGFGWVIGVLRRTVVQCSVDVVKWGVGRLPLYDVQLCSAQASSGA
jgi:hypothetical protein